MELPSAFGVLSGNPGSALLVQRSLFVVGTRGVLARTASTLRFSPSLPRRVACDHTTILPWGSASYRVFPAPPAGLPFGAGPSHGFLAPSAHEAPGVRFTRGIRPRHVPASGILTLLPVYSSQRRPGLFHPGGTRGVPPFRGLFPPKKPRHLLGVRLALLAFFPTSIRRPWNRR